MRQNWCILFTQALLAMFLFFLSFSNKCSECCYAITLMKVLLNVTQSKNINDENAMNRKRNKHIIQYHCKNGKRSGQYILLLLFFYQKPLVANINFSKSVNKNNIS